MSREARPAGRDGHLEPPQWLPDAPENLTPAVLGSTFVTVTSTLAAANAAKAQMRESRREAETMSGASARPGTQTANEEIFRGSRARGAAGMDIDAETLAAVLRAWRRPPRAAGRSGNGSRPLGAGANCRIRQTSGWDPRDLSLTGATGASLRLSRSRLRPSDRRKDHSLVSDQQIRLAHGLVLARSMTKGPQGLPRRRSLRSPMARRWWRRRMSSPARMTKIKCSNFEAAERCGRSRRRRRTTACWWRGHGGSSRRQGHTRTSAPMGGFARRLLIG